MTRLPMLGALLLLAAFGRGAAAQGTPTASERDVLRAERAYLEARVKNDTATLRRLLADEFVTTGTGGGVGDKATALRGANVTPGGDTIQAMDVDDVRVRTYGTTAVVTGRRTQRTAQGQAQLRFTHVFVRRQGRWQLAASQVGTIAAAADSARRPNLR